MVLVSLCTKDRVGEAGYQTSMVSVTSTSRYRSPWKVDPLWTAEVDSTELADVRADWINLSRTYTGSLPYTGYCY